LPELGERELSVVAQFELSRVPHPSAFCLGGNFDFPRRIWQTRFRDFNLCAARQRVKKLRYRTGTQ